MIPKFVINWVVTAVALAVAAKIVSGIHVNGSWLTYLWIAIVFGFINATIGVIFKVFTFPFVILSLGLFLVVINALMLGLTAALLTPFSIDNFGSALLASVIISTVSMLLDWTIVKPFANAR